MKNRSHWHTLTEFKLADIMTNITYAVGSFSRGLIVMLGRTLVHSFYRKRS